MIVRTIVRNVLGYTLVVAGLGLSLPGVPGPGTALVLAGLALADWPGKRRFFRWMRSFAWFEALDRWLHRRFGIELPEKGSGSASSTATKGGVQDSRATSEKASA